MLNSLEGYRSYIQATLIAVFSILFHFGIIEGQVYLLLLSLLGAGSIASIRASIANKK